jgi:alkylation response protein AidB-like acyl-CoA dehydrogenase
MSIAESVLTKDEQRVNDLVSTLLEQFPPATTPPREFLGAQFDAGLAWVHFPEGHGGLGLNAKVQKLVNERVQGAGAPHAGSRNPIGYGMCGPTVAVWGSEAQKSRYLRPLFTGEEIWCQLFSEPGAGSDFAGLSSRGVRDGDEWICNGQKVWTTLGHLARFGLLVVRTDTEAVKHAGLSAFVVDMHDPTVASDDRRSRVQRGLFHRHAHPQQRNSWCAWRWLAGVVDHPDERTGLDWWSYSGQRLGHYSRPDQDLGGPARRAS